MLNWIRSFLSERTHSIKMESYRSNTQSLTCGVPQGSALSPLFFNCYMRPLADLITSYGLGCQIYADDTQILADLASGPNMPEQLNKGLSNIQQWMDSNRLGLNADKTELLLIGPQANSTFLPAWPSSFGPAPTPAKQVKNLGIIFDAELSFVTHAKYCIKSANYHLQLLRKIKNLFT